MMLRVDDCKNGYSCNENEKIVFIKFVIFHPISTCHTKYKCWDTVEKKEMCSIIQIFINEIIDYNENSQRYDT